tara:strand:- start:949 stop:1101 length:153 start_codon:yes stop_codon:yes gene_type:complete
MNEKQVDKFLDLMYEILKTLKEEKDKYKNENLKLLCEIEQYKNLINNQGA